ncbi:MAG TPA: response regulator [Candidatus Limnocylindrales bacterium]|nr:response regulator [Candidatus Limnocylindrales bacterium]
MTEPTVLLVEDDPNDELLTIRALRKENIANHIVVVRDGQEALDYLFATGAYAGRNLAVLPHVMLLDLKLPKVNGLEVLARVRGDDRLSTLPVVILTSSAMDRDIVEGYRLGANGYVQKPVGADEFRDAVQRLGLYWLLVNKVPASS